MSKINVLWVIDHVCYDGSLHGGGRLFYNVVPLFDKEKFKIIPCFLRASEQVKKVFADAPVPVRLLDKAKFDPTALFTFLKLIREEKIDVMHLHCYAASTLGRIASLMTRVPAIIHDYDTQIYFPYPAYLWLFDRLLSGVTGKALAASPMVREYMIKRRALKPEKVQMLFHALPEEKFRQATENEIVAVKASLNIKNSDKVAITITKLGPHRGNEFLLQAAAELIKKYPNIIFLLVYKPTYYHRLPQEYKHIDNIDKPQLFKAELLKEAERLNIMSNVRFIEYTQNADKYLDSADFFIAPFMSERFSSVNILEAMAKAKPVIATDIGEQKEIIQDGINGFLFSPGNIKELILRIEVLLNNPQKLKEISSTAQQEAQKYSVTAYINNLQFLYTELAHAHKRHA